MAQILDWNAGYRPGTPPWSVIVCPNRRKVEDYLTADSILLLNHELAWEHLRWLTLVTLTYPRAIIAVMDAPSSPALPPFLRQVSRTGLDSFLLECMHRHFTPVDPRERLYLAENALNGHLPVSPQPLPYRVVFFDNDGTVTDSEDYSVKAIQRGVREVCRAHGIPARTPSRKKILNLLGLNIQGVFRHFLPPAAGEYADEATRTIRACFHELIPTGRLYPGVETTLAQLRNRGYRMFLISNSSPAYFYRVVEVFGLAKWFDGLLCSGERPGMCKGEMIAELQQRHGLRGGTMVGDREVDIRGGRQAGCRTVGCAYGYGGAGEIAGCEVTIREFSELLDLLD
jgi:phosphoglycolate phosphatase